jgi:hypothetical protein
MDVQCLCYVCAFFCVCIQLEALSRVDHPPKESLMQKLNIESGDRSPNNMHPFNDKLFCRIK